jgi:hypothetical protein
MAYAHFLGCVGGGLWFARVFCAIVRRKLFVSPRLKVTLHQVESFADRRTRRVEDPCTVGAAPTTKARLVYPHHLALGWELGFMLCSGGHVVYDTEHVDPFDIRQTL